MVLQRLISIYRVPNGLFRAEGTIKNVNTIEDYRKLDRTKILNQAGRTVRFVTRNRFRPADGHFRFGTRSKTVQSTRARPSWPLLHLFALPISRSTSLRTTLDFPLFVLSQLGRSN